MGERRKAKRHAAQVRVRLRYPDVETFIEKFSVNVSRGGIFIRTREPRDVDALVRFEFQLQDGKPVFRGEGKVVWVKDFLPDAPNKPHGMGLKFTRLDRKSRDLIDRILKHKAEHKAKKKADAAEEASEETEAEESAEAAPAEDAAAEEPETSGGSDEAPSDEGLEAAVEEDAPAEAGADEGLEAEAEEDVEAAAEEDAEAGAEEAAEAGAEEAAEAGAEEDAEAEAAEAAEAAAEEDAEAEAEEDAEAEAEESAEAGAEGDAEAEAEEDAEAEAEEDAEADESETIEASDETPPDEEAEAAVEEDAPADPDVEAEESAEAEAAEDAEAEAEGDAEAEAEESREADEPETIEASDEAPADEEVEAAVEEAAPADPDVEAEEGVEAEDGVEAEAAVEEDAPAEPEGEAIGGPFDEKAAAEIAAAVRDAVTSGQTVEEMMDMALDVGAVVARETADRPVDPDGIDGELEGLEPEGFDTAAAVERLRGWDGDGPPPMPPSAEAMAPAEAAHEQPEWDDDSEELSTQVDAEPLSADEASAAYAAGQARASEAPEAAYDVRPEDATPFIEEAQQEHAPEPAEAEPVDAAADLAAPAPEPSEYADGTAEALVGEGDEETSAPDALFETGEIPELLDDLLDPNDALLDAADIQSTAPAEGTGDLTLEDPSAAVGLAYDEAAPAEPETFDDVAEQALAEDPEVAASYRGEPIVESVDVDLELDSFEAALEHEPRPSEIPPPPPEPVPEPEGGHWQDPPALYTDEEGYGDGGATVVQMDLDATTAGGPPPGAMPPPPPMPSQEPPPAAAAAYDDSSEADDALDELMSDLKGPSELYAPESGPDLIAADELEDEPLEEQTSRLPATQAEELVQAMAVPSEALPVLHEQDYDESMATVAEHIEFDESGAPTQSPAPGAHDGADGRGETKMGVPLRLPDDEGLDEATVPADSPAFEGGPTFGPGGIDPQEQPAGELPPEGYEQTADEEGLPEQSPLGEDGPKKKGFFRKLFGGGE